MVAASGGENGPAAHSANRTDCVGELWGYNNDAITKNKCLITLTLPEEKKRRGMIFLRISSGLRNPWGFRIDLEGFPASVRQHALHDRLF